MQADSAPRRAPRHKILDFMRDLQLKLETLHDTLSRFAGMQLDITAARIAEDLNIFNILDESNDALTVTILATRTGAHLPGVILEGRILRYLASEVGINEAGEGIFAANSIMKTLARPGYRDGVYHFFNDIGPVPSALQAFLAENKYQDVSNAGRTAFQKAFRTDLPAFMWHSKQPERFGSLQQVMTVNGAADVPWYTIFPFEKERGTFQDLAALADVGGGFGHQCVALLAGFPHLHGKLLSTHLDGIKVMEHDFFQLQPVKNARFYYLRGIMHDWPDDECIVILKNLISAIGTDSQILIDETALPSVGVPQKAATINLTMMVSLGSRERTQQE
ncbi:O-methyl transferase B [Hypoxylon sp. NC0597]|nr:O-methyl transferase B [Hypoxylon sp. NC0597]